HGAVDLHGAGDVPGVRPVRDEDGGDRVGHGAGGDQEHGGRQGSDDEHHGESGSFHRGLLRSVPGVRPTKGRRLGAAFFRREAEGVGRDLLGRTLCRRLPNGTVLRGRVTEVEAYLGERDLASHARFGMTKRNRGMWEPGGRAYVYFVYGMHYCMNVVT